jgi:hypothetical protein
MSNRPDVPRPVERAVLVEAGHRCAIPTCRQPTTEIAHIVPWSESHDNSFENLIALCPNCHTRYDNKEEIDRKSIRMYKRNLGILNSRYSEIERRLFAIIAETGRRFFIFYAGFDIMLMNAVRDGFLTPRADMDGFVHSDEDNRDYPSAYGYDVTAEGVEFANRYISGEDLS